MKRALGVTGLFTALTVAMAYPWSVHLSSQVLADLPDIHLYIWNLAWDAHAFLHQPLSIFDANIYYPNPNTLAYSENLIGTALTVAPLLWAGVDPVLAMNLAAMMTCLLCGLGTYLLARRVGVSSAAAILAGIVFAFAPPRFMRMGQIHITAVQWIPFSLAYLHSYFDGGRPRDLRLAIAFLTLQALTGGHGAVFLLVSIVVLLAFKLASGEPPAVARRIRDIGWTGALLTVPAFLMFLPYRRAQQEVGLVRALDDWMPAPDSFLASPSHLHQWAIALFSTKHYNDSANAWLFPGILPLIFAVVAVVSLRGAPRLRQSYVLLYLLIALISFDMFLAPPFGLWPHLYWLPGFNFIRVPSRFIILTMLALAVLTGLGFDSITSRFRPVLRTASAMVVGVLLLGEFATQPFKGVPYALDTPAIDRWLNTLPKPFAIAEVPVPSPGEIGAFERQQTMAMLHSMAHWQKTVHGYSGLRPRLHWRVLVELTAFPDEPSLRSLRELKIRYVVVHTDRYPPGKWEDVQARLDHYDGVRLLHTEGAGRVYEIVQ